MSQFTTEPRGREIHFIDVENLLGGPQFTAGDVQALRYDYQAVSHMAAEALVVVGASATVPALEAKMGWSGSRLLWQPGKDGAELALLAAIEGEEIARRFARVVVGSGDGIFTPAVTKLAGLGVHVTVVSRTKSLSWALRQAASHVCYLDGADLATHGRVA